MIPQRKWLLKNCLKIIRFIIKTYLKVWSGFTKFIRSQTAQGKVVDTGILGLFYMDAVTKNMIVNSEISVDFNNFYYQPTIRMLDETEIILHENEFNISPYNELTQQVIKMNISGIASVWHCRSETVNHVLHEFAKKLYSTIKNTEIFNQLIVINLRIGYLKI